jgi:hypothetical protein
MSHRVTTETEIKDKVILTQACKSTNITFTDQGADHIRFTSGAMANATLDLRTGRITGDSDYGHTASGLSALKQAYGEAKYKGECARQGIQIESRTTDHEGNIILMCSMG